MGRLAGAAGRAALFAETGRRVEKQDGVGRNPRSVSDGLGFQCPGGIRWRS